MRTAYLECATGISGDMTLAALIDAGASAEAIQQGIASLNLPGVELVVSEIMKSCFRAKSIEVRHPEQHAHRHYADIVKLLDEATALSDRQRSLAKEIFLAIAQAEARVHGTTVDNIHFHEVGAIDSIVDIVGAAIGFDLLKVDQIICSPIPTGHGHVHIDHGICAVPTPGTAELLKGIPLANVPIEAELTTPTGAAIVKTLVDRFGTLPAMTIESVGYGAGTMNFASRANLLRIFVGKVEQRAAVDDVCLLETNLDDVTAEVIGHTKQLLLSAGALDVYSIPIQMKKDRPGSLLSVITRPDQQTQMEGIVFKETGTLGIRAQRIQRSVRPRKEHQVLTPLGAVAGKLAWQRNGTIEFSPEFEECARVATENQCSLREVYRAALVAFSSQQPELSMEVPVDSGTVNPDSHSHDHDHHGHDHDSHSHDHDDHHHDHG